VKDDIEFIRLLDLYSPLLTATKREICNLYFNCDLSLGEIAEEKGVSRQSVSDCLQKCRKQLEKYEEKLGFCKILDENGEIFSAYSTLTENFLTEEEKKGNKEAELLNRELKEIRKRFGEDNADLE
jgi:predicted DNA-binding protein YlxM (UPF0122 family)